MNVVENAAGRDEMARLGARSLPVVAQGERFVIAQVIRDVVEFLGLDEQTGPVLAPAQLASRLGANLATAVRLTRQMPNARLADELPNRPRSWRVLMHHVFQVPTAFLDAEMSGTPMTYEALVAPPPERMRTARDIADFGDAVRARLERWWSGAEASDFDAIIDVYFGRTSRHELLERTTWHATQHIRQVASLLERAGVTPDSPLSAADLDGLPLTQRIWDD